MTRKLEADVKRLTEALEDIRAWAEAYPDEVFIEPDWHKAQWLLAQGGMTLDAISGSLMRRAMRGVAKLATAALEGRNATSP